jgi:hypothetical protein
METKTKPSSAEFEDHLIDACIEEFCKEIKWPEPAPSPLRTKPVDEVKVEFKKIIKHIFFNRDLKERTYKGFLLIQENLKATAKSGMGELRLAAAVMFNYAVMNMMEHKDLLYLIIDEDADKLKIDTEKIKKATEGDGEFSLLHSLADEIGISEASLNSFYQIGYEFFKQEKHEDARCVFQFLSSLNPCSHELWIALGMSHQKLSDWFSAVYSYSMASLMNPFNPVPYIHSAECFISNSDKKNAQGSLNLAEYFLTDNNREAFMPIIVDLRQKT